MLTSVCVAYSEITPQAPLARWIECAWSIESGPVTGHRVPPDGCVDIIYQRGQGLRAVGAMTVEQRFDYPGGVWTTGVRFRPGMAAPFLGASPAELTDQSVALEGLLSRRARELARRLDDARSVRDAMRILLGSMPAPASQPNPVQQAIEALTAANGNADLENTARQATISPRQFRRRCLEESGLTPKHLCRVLRFRHACRVARAAGQPNWSDVALAANYFDQAHFIRDFREFTGLTPMAVFSNTRSSRQS